MSVLSFSLGSSFFLFFFFVGCRAVIGFLVSVE